MLVTSELEILATVEPGDTILDLATRLDHSESYVSRSVAALSEKGLVDTERNGRRKLVTPSDARAVELYQNLVRQHPHIDFPEVLTAKSLEVLYHFDHPNSVIELASASDNYRNTVNRVLKRLRNRGLVGKDNGQYRFNGDFERLHEFARELAHHLHRVQLESVAPKGTILWEGYTEFLAQAEKDIDAEGFHETGLARFAEYDLQFLVTSHRYYFYSRDTESISAVDICCHLLLINDDTRHRSYAMLMLCHVDIDEETLRELAVKYGLEETIDLLLRYLETSGDVGDTHLPEWSEFTDLAADYGVAIPA